ncbi:tyrosine-type recombinase/integrase [Labrenzia sp. DG1229]|uniref:tyrosine-type recombinase/integrase n=1 Tax=Labrenzia sp. DG1229 TaxID=681847 RepID=UPI00068D6941|nr:tyrosine-type recombinase/integrase [Labrenzia sp. DG1229]
MINDTHCQQFLDFCEDQRNLSANTVTAYRQDLKAFLIFYKSTDTGDNTNQQTVLRYLRYLRNAKRLKPSTVQRRVMTLRACLEWMRQFKSGSPSPFDGLRLTFRSPKLVPRAIDANTLKHLLKNEESNPVPKHSFSKDAVTFLIMRILIVTGLRIGELTGLNIKDVFSQDSKIRVFGKGSRERIVYIANDELYAEFVKFLHWRRASNKPSAQLFPNRCGERLTPPALRKRLKLLCASKNITPHLTPHQFRHSAATQLIENGVDIRMVQRLLGHASLATTEIYTYVSDQALQLTLVRADVLSRLDPGHSKTFNIYKLLPKRSVAENHANRPGMFVVGDPQAAESVC